MQTNPNQLTPEENIQADNELKALNLELRYGALHTHFSEDVPPELISQWLDNVTKYEEKYAKAEMVSMHKFIGEPKIRPLSTLRKSEIQPEIERLLGLLRAHFVLTEQPEHLSPKGYYRFLSEEFMQHQMTNIAIEGMIHFLPYDDFHRDGPQFIEDHTSDFIQDLMGLDRAYEGVWLSDNLRDDEEIITKAEAMERIAAFRACYKKIEFGAFAPVKLQQTDSGMYFIFHAEWFGTPVQISREREQHDGLGLVQVAFEDGDWMVQGVMMPGFKF